MRNKDIGSEQLLSSVSSSDRPSVRYSVESSRPVHSSVSPAVVHKATLAAHQPPRSSVSKGSRPADADKVMTRKRTRW